MTTSLSKELRKLLEKVTGQARILAEAASRAALENLAVHEKEYRSHMTVDQRKLRNRLRARGRALGDTRDERTGSQELTHLTEAAAYEHWHRLLFTRFLTENHLLITDEANGCVPVTLEECEELAPELGARDGLDLACRFASLTLPGVFRRDDPVLELPIAINDQVEMRKLLASLPSECFVADDSLGWTYQFWQAQKKDEVNKSGKKIGADELSPVTQLFTEDYMVEFLLHNTLGAWWAGKLGPIAAATEQEARAKAGLPARDGVPAIAWTYLRFVKGEAPSSKVEAVSSKVEAASSRFEEETSSSRLKEFGYLNKEEQLASLSGNLPHWRQNGVTYFVTFRAADSLPQEKLQQWIMEKEAWLALHPEPHDETVKREFHEKFHQKLEHWLDQGFGACHLERPEVKKIVEDALRHFDGERYFLDEFVVMPNHVHVLITPIAGHELSEILHSWKSFSAKEINKIIESAGTYWQKEFFDHIVRNPAQLEKIRQYIRDHTKTSTQREPKPQDAASTPIQRSPAPSSKVEAASSRFREETPSTPSLWTPAAGTFDGWPREAAKVTLLDPCMGSGHFLVFALPLLVRLRMEEEKLDKRSAVLTVS